MNNAQSVSNKLANVAKKNMLLWLETLETKDAKKVAVLYTEDATFLPTVSGEFKRGQDGAEDYFDHFLAKNPEAKVVKESIVPISEDAYLHVGMYDFVIDGEDNHHITVHARFDYLWEQDENGEWRIAHHHSSLKPE